MWTWLAQCKRLDPEISFHTWTEVAARVLLSVCHRWSWTLNLKWTTAMIWVSDISEFPFIQSQEWFARYWKSVFSWLWSYVFLQIFLSFRIWSAMVLHGASPSRSEKDPSLADGKTGAWWGLQDFPTLFKCCGIFTSHSTATMHEQRKHWLDISAWREAFVVFWLYISTDHLSLQE